MVKLLIDIEAFTGIVDVPDTIRWRHNGDGFFCQGAKGGAEVTWSYGGV